MGLRRRLGVLALGVALLLALGVALLLGSGTARADGAFGDRVFGFGFGTSAGFTQSYSRFIKVAIPEAGLLDVSLHLPIGERFELQLWVPVSWVLYQQAATGPFFDGALLFHVRPLRGYGFFVAPGLDVIAWVPDKDQPLTEVQFNVPIAVGYEFTSPSKLFGFSIALRPLVGAAVSDQAGFVSVATNLGVMLETNLRFFVMRRRPAPEVR